MNIICEPAALHGALRAIPSKSDAHRKLICAALSENSCIMDIFPPYCDDLQATMRCLSALGAKFEDCADGLHITPIMAQNISKCDEMDCGESGSTFRFLLPVAKALQNEVKFVGHGRLPERPISVLADEMSKHGVVFSSQMLPFSTNGILHGGHYEIVGNISSQFLSGLLMALPLCEEDSEIVVTTRLQSAVYVDMTIHVLQTFGIEIDCSTPSVYRIHGHQKYHAPTSLSVDGDWSNAAFWLAANALGSDIQLSNLQEHSLQSDKAILSLLRDFFSTQDTLSVDMEQIPDSLPILAVCAAFRNGKTQFVNAARLRLKESDRLLAVARLISDLGGCVHEFDDSMTVFGTTLHSGTVDACGDHRLAMSAAIAALRCQEPVTILGAECVKKSYPRFFEDYQALGGKCHVIDIR